MSKSNDGIEKGLLLVMTIVLVISLVVNLPTSNITGFDLDTRDKIIAAIRTYEQTSGREFEDFQSLKTPYNDTNGDYHEALIKDMNFEGFILEKENKLIKSKYAFIRDGFFYGNYPDEIINKYNITFIKPIPLTEMSELDFLLLISHLPEDKTVLYEAKSVKMDKNNVIITTEIRNNELTIKKIQKQDVHKILVNYNIKQPLIHTQKGNKNVVIELPDGYPI